MEMTRKVIELLERIRRNYGEAVTNARYSNADIHFIKMGEADLNALDALLDNAKALQGETK